MALAFEYLGMGLQKMRAKSTLEKEGRVAQVRGCDGLCGRR